MNRRRVLASAGVALLGILGGCSGDDGTGANGSEATAGSTGTDGPDGTSARPTTGATSGSETSARESTGTGRPVTTDGEPTTEPATTTSATTQPETTDASATVTTGSDGTATPPPDPQSTQLGEGAAITFEEGGSRVVVTGTIMAQDGCRRAVLDSVQSDGGTLVVSVGTERDAGTDVMCTQALTPVEYRFAVTPDDLPDSVRVVHDGAGDRRTVATTDRTG
ncbi:hypothetical protein [Halococcus sp. IIIV-5B]|uniref:hypothetical protein n=1 Tax=Halococcus sp. IIIV-5B TaxID=2321230 RepID=UPI000E71F9FB|nr:hypothetical protein [Halococcus sp. IIIV-5B]RJT03846.1 hypothetical protein D3261_10390 [Halococcus sp. IIIV-5B]